MWASEKRTRLPKCDCSGISENSPLRPKWDEARTLPFSEILKNNINLKEDTYNYNLLITYSIYLN